MVLEYIIEDSKYQEFIKDKIPQRGKTGPINVTHKKFSGINNYILTIEYTSSPVDSAETLLNIFPNIKETFDANKVKYYVLRNEASLELVNRLYPLVCEFETKLRKFLYVALFDLDEAAQKLTHNKIKTVIQKYSKTDIFPQGNFLEDLTLGDVFNLLFDNKEFLDAAKKETAQIENTLSRKATKKELIAILEKIEEKTLWNALFAPFFKSFSLPSAQSQLFSIRNDVMHFHFISFSQYKSALTLLKKINKELDVQLSKGIVLENNEDNVTLVSNNYQYTLKALATIAENIQVLNNQISAAFTSSVAPVISALSAITHNLTSPLVDLTNNLYPILSMLYEPEAPQSLLKESSNSSESEESQKTNPTEDVEDN